MYVQVYLFQVLKTSINLCSWVPQNLWNKLLDFCTQVTSDVMSSATVT